MSGTPSPLKSPVVVADQASFRNHSYRLSKSSMPISQHQVNGADTSGGVRTQYERIRIPIAIEVINRDDRERSAGRVTRYNRKPVLPMRIRAGDDDNR